MNIVRARGVFWDTVDGETVVCDADVGELYRFNRIAAYLWDNCDNASVGSLTVLLAANFPDLDTKQLTDDIQRFVDLLLDKKLVVAKG